MPTQSDRLPSTDVVSLRGSGLKKCAPETEVSGAPSRPDSLVEEPDRPGETHVVAAAKLVEILQRKLLRVRVFHRDLQAQRPQLVDEDLERFRNPRLRQGLSLHDRLVSLDPSHDVVRLDRQKL